MLILGDRKFVRASFDTEAELESVVVAYSEHLFGPSSLYFPKALIRTIDGSGAIPDGYVIDLDGMRWFIVEAELISHSVWNHIAPQVAKQVIAARNPASHRLLAELMVTQIREDAAAREKFADLGIADLDVRRVLSEILATPPTIGMPIDDISSDLQEWAETLKVNVKLWIVRKHVELGHPERVVYEIPEEFQPALDTEENITDASEKTRSGVTISDLVQAKLLREDQRILMAWQPRGGGDRRVFEGRITNGGEIDVSGLRFTSPSNAAVYVLRQAGSDRYTENGWKKWKTEDGALLATVRDQYLRTLNAKVGKFAQ